MHCSICVYLCTAPQCLSYSAVDKSSLRNHLKITGLEFGEVEIARQAVSAIEAESGEGPEKAAALRCRELRWVNSLPYHFYSSVGFCRTLDKGGTW